MLFDATKNPMEAKVSPLKSGVYLRRRDKHDILGGIKEILGKKHWQFLKEIK